MMIATQHGNGNEKGFYLGNLVVNPMLFFQYVVFFFLKIEKGRKEKETEDNSQKSRRQPYTQIFTEIHCRNPFLT